MHLPACCIYGGDPENGNNYGILYNWYAIHDSRGLAPQGWHIPTEKEWNILVNYLGGNDNAGYKMKSPLGWESNGNGDNSSGFSALPSGCRSQVGTFYLLGGNGYYWSSTKSNSGNALACGLYSNGSYVTLNASNIAYGYACRCIKD
jgi:uncharacterized protein (TIGR02145 family)